MLAWLTVLELTSRLEQNIDELIAERRATICCTREINLKLADADRVFTRINTQFAARATDVGHLDGLSMSMRNGWRFSLTRSKTEPLIRLNMESRAGTECLLTEGAALLHLLQPFDEAGDDLSTRLVIQ